MIMVEKLLTSSSYWSPANIPDAALIIYTVTNRRTFLEASDVLYHLRRPKTWPDEKSPPEIQITENGRQKEDIFAKENGREKPERRKLSFKNKENNNNNSKYKRNMNAILDEYNKKCKYLPVFFVGNKIDVERQRAVHFS
uniref:Uncharacterized protein n=1 Tax=Romanomermis culicivorax TaxID=13658 RepID=A0A915I1H7_ROMCU